MSEADSEVAKRCKRIDVPFNRILQGSNLAALETTRHAPFFLILCDPPSKRATSKRILDTFSRSGPKSRNEAEANVAASHLTTVVNVWFREVPGSESEQGNPFWEASARENNHSELYAVFGRFSYTATESKVPCDRERVETAV